MVCHSKSSEKHYTPLKGWETKTHRQVLEAPLHYRDQVGEEGEEVGSDGRSVTQGDMPQLRKDDEMAKRSARSENGERRIVSFALLITAAGE